MHVGPRQAADEIQVSSVLVKLIEQVEVPAREAGVLDSVAVREGEMVEAGAALAQIDDTDAQFDKRTAEIELVAARKLAESDVKVRIRARNRSKWPRRSCAAPSSRKRLPESVIGIGAGPTAAVGAKRQRWKSNRPSSNWTWPRPSAELKEIDVQTAEHTSTSGRSRPRWPASWPRSIGTRANGCSPARRSCASCASIGCGPKGWSTPRGPRRLHGPPARLTVEIDGQPVEFAGKIVFVSPEIDPVNGQVRVWAEIDNPEFTCGPACTAR